jgi:hypothetical protein
MRIYRSKKPYFSGTENEKPSNWPADYHEPEEMDQAGLTGWEALDNAFSQSHYAGRGLNVGDVVGLEDGSLHRVEMSGWTELPEKQWTARIQQGQGRAK